MRHRRRALIEKSRVLLITKYSIDRNVPRGSQLNHGSALWLPRGRNTEDDGRQEKQPMTRKTGWSRSVWR